MPSPPRRPSLARQFIHLLYHHGDDPDDFEILKAKISWFGYHSYTKYQSLPYGWYRFTDGSIATLYPSESPDDNHR